MSKTVKIAVGTVEVVEIPYARHNEMIQFKQLKGDPHWDERAGESEECDCQVYYSGLVWSQVMSSEWPPRLASVP